MNTYHDRQECHTITDWLSKTNFPAQQTDFFSRCQEGTGVWLLESTEYQQWINCVEPTLFCPGIPGAGKTFLTSIVINDLLGRFDEDPDVGVAYMYCNYKRRTEQTIENLLATLLKQLIQKKPSLYTEVRGLYLKHRQKGTRPSLDELRTTLNGMIGKLTRVFLLIDALDECTDLDRSRLLRETFSLQAHGTLSVFATSRCVPEVMSEFEGKSSIEIRATSDDVRRYLEKHLIELPICVRRNVSLQETIVVEITKAVDGM